MAVEGMAAFLALQDHHLPNMDECHQKALILRVAGTPDAEVARLELVSESTLKNRLGVASAEIAMALPERRRLTSDQRGFWVRSHLKFCLKATFAALWTHGG